MYIIIYIRIYIYIYVYIYIHICQPLINCDFAQHTVQISQDKTRLAVNSSCSAAARGASVGTWK